MPVQLTEAALSGTGRPLFQIGMGKVATAQFEDNPLGKLDVRIWLQHA